MSVRCEKCSQPTPEHKVRHDIQGIPLCPECWLSEPWYYHEETP